MPVARIAFWVATAGALALLARTLWLGPPPLWVAAAASAAYVGLLLVGVLVLRLGMYVDVVVRGPDDARGVALTFDDGPHPEHTARVLDLLRDAGVRATFFVVGEKAERHPDVVRRMVREGHAVGTHSYSHDRFLSSRSPKRIERDLVRSLDVLEGLTGKRPTLFRPPVGHSTPRLASVVRKLGLDVVGWTERGLDGLRTARSDRVAARLTGALEDGAILLLHDAAERDDFVPASLDALPLVLANMRERGLEGVTVERWVDES